MQWIEIFFVLLESVQLAEGEFCTLMHTIGAATAATTLALVIVLHNISVKRKFVPSAQEEKQLVDVAVLLVGSVCTR